MAIFLKTSHTLISADLFANIGANLAIFMNIFDNQKELFAIL